MNKYKVYFEIYGKKFRTTIIAKSENEAKETLKGNIIFHKIEDDEEVELEKDFMKHFLEFLNIAK